MMRNIAAQLIQQNLELAPYVCENYANKGFSPSIPHLRKLLSELLSMIPPTRIFVDGLDEYPSKEQRSLLTELLALTKAQQSQCKILFSSRDVCDIRKCLQNKPFISFTDEKDALDVDIRVYVKDKLKTIRENHLSHESLVDDIESKIVEKAKGK
jgi:hypothetical protein